jgi:hypothetical protein
MSKSLVIIRVRTIFVNLRETLLGHSMADSQRSPVSVKQIEKLLEV